MRSILIIARSALWRDVLAARLERECCAITIANDAARALAALSTSVPGALLLDTTLPKKECQRVHTRLDRDPRLQTIRRLFVVGALAGTTGPQSGPVFEKPVDPEHVARALRSLYPESERATASSGLRSRAPDRRNQAIEAGPGARFMAHVPRAGSGGLRTVGVTPIGMSLNYALAARNRRVFFLQTG